MYIQGGMFIRFLVFIYFNIMMINLMRVHVNFVCFDSGIMQIIEVAVLKFVFGWCDDLTKI